MNIVVEKQNLLQWIQGLNDEKIIEEILDLKNKNQISDFENQIIQKGLNDVLNGDIATYEEVKKRFEAKFATSSTSTI
ncbi:hypothetical protein [Flavobacterium marginilacus]|uniref:hypothetical protein n=1 Tax=Flavobacterium marginilacus TaxID=3003256 RepID=UPI00248DB82C|nr:hypothetical protein [Flavobacterium marginilacus]